MAINIHKLYKEYLYMQCKDQLDAQRRDIQEDDVHTRVKFEVENMEWRDKRPTAEPEVCRRVDYTQKNADGSKATGHLHTKKGIENSAKVILKKGTVGGLNGTFIIKLPLDERKQDLIKAFGNYLNVDLSKDESVPQLNKMDIESAIDGELGPKGATATVCDRQKEYTGHFVCTVIMKGKCLANGSQQHIGDVIWYLQSAQPTNTDLNALSVMKRQGKKGNKNVVQFVLEGDLECKFDFNESMEWEKNP